MQFFLALVALGGIACSFHGVHSYESYSFVPGHFSIFKSPEERIEGFQFFIGQVLNLFKGIKLKINGQWTKTHGYANGRLNEFVLRKNENIKKITMFSKLCIRGIEIETDAGRTFRAGNSNGQRSTIFPPEKGMVFNGITIYFNLICIKRMMFHWIHTPQTILTPEVTTEENCPENTSTAPAKTTQAAPAKTTPAAPAKTTPAAPAKTTPAAPAKTTPATTAKTTPAAPAKTTPAAPAKTTPATTAKTTPAAPAKTTPAAPAKTTPATTAKTTPAAPAKTTPATPAKTIPAAPATTTPDASDGNTSTATAENIPSSPTGNTPTASDGNTSTATAENIPSSPTGNTPTASDENTPTTTAENN